MDWAKISPFNLREVQLPKEGWLERQFASAQNELAQRPDLRIRASLFAGERQQQTLGESGSPSGDRKREVVRGIFPKSTELK